MVNSFSLIKIIGLHTLLFLSILLFSCDGVNQSSDRFPPADPALGSKNVVSTPSFSVYSDYSFVDPLTVTISTTTEGAKIV